MSNPFQRLILKLHILRKMQSPRKKNPSEKFDALQKFQQNLSKLIGMRTFIDMKNDWYSAAPGFMAAIYFILNIYTIQYYFVRNEFLKVIECTYLVGAAIAVRKILQSIFRFYLSSKLNLFYFPISTGYYNVLESDWTSSF